MISDSSANPPALSTAPLGHDTAPFLVWSVSRREFYFAICLAMLPALAWGTIIFGVRVLTILGACFIAVTVMHLVLKKMVAPRGWKGAQSLLYAHCLTSTMVLIALIHPTWPVWSVAVFASLIPLILALIGGPGRECIHISVALVVILQFAVLPSLARFNTYTGSPDAILAHDRLFMGDIRYQRNGSLDSWPSSRVLNGNDALRMKTPSRSAVETFDRLSARMADGAAEPFELQLTQAQQSEFSGIFARVYAFDLPGMDLQMLGAVPGRVGTVSLPAIILAGLYLSYRYILRPRSLVMFVLSFVVGTFLFAFWPAALARAGGLGMWNLLTTFPGEIGTLINHLLLNSDAGFAAVFILALPGTEPLTARGRRFFLVLAGFAAAALHRTLPNLPAATFILCALMPFAPVFDRLFWRRSWLNAKP